MDYTVRQGRKDDVSSILSLIKELAVYEKAGEQVENTEAQLLEDGFGKDPVFKVLVAESNSNSDIIGIALYYTAYSTWKGRMIYLDDLVVSRNHRRKGIGEKLIRELFKIASDEGASLVKWEVLDWNTPAIEFYKKLGVKFDQGWTNCTIYKDQIRKFAD